MEVKHVLEDAHFNLMMVNALHLSLEFADLIREGYSSYYRGKSEWKKDNRIETKARYFWRLDRLCIPRNFERRLRLITELHEISSGVPSTFAKELGRFWWKRSRQDVKDFCERGVVCRRAKILPQMAATLHPLHVPPKPWHISGIDYLTHLHMSDGFESVLILVDQLTRMGHFMPFQRNCFFVSTWSRPIA
jgi:hypothetical protein